MLHLDAPQRVEVARTYERAADLILENGWTQGTDQNLAGEFCARGAIRRAASGAFQETSVARERAVSQGLAEMHFETTLNMSITGWNDNLHPDEGRSIVVNTLRAFAASLTDQMVRGSMVEGRVPVAV